MRSAFCIARERELDGATAADKVHDDGNEREEQQKVNKEAGDVEDEEATNPEKDEYDGEDKEHGTCFLGFRSRLPLLEHRQLRPTQGERRKAAEVLLLPVQVVGLAAASDGRDEHDFVAILEGVGFTAEKADVLVIDIDVDEAPELP